MKRIIVYYSYTGHTKMIANYMAKKLNCEIQELKPVKPYSTDYQTVVSEEQTNDVELHLRDYEVLNIDLKKYDEIILGSPVWWYHLSPVVRTFLKKENLEGKIIRPYVTNAGWLGQTFKEIEALAKNQNAKVTSGLNVLFTEDYTENKVITKLTDIDKWLGVQND